MNEKEFPREIEIRKEFYYDQIDTLSDKLIAIKHYMEANPYSSVEELYDFFDKDERTKKLPAEQIENFKRFIKRYVDNVKLVRDTSEEFKDRPRELFNRILSEATSQKVKLRESPSQLCFLVVNNLLNSFLKPSSFVGKKIKGTLLTSPGHFKDKRFEGLVSLVDINQDDKEIEHTIEHERRHILFKNYFSKVYPSEFELKEEPKDLKDFIQNLSLLRQDLMCFILSEEYAGHTDDEIFDKCDSSKYKKITREEILKKAQERLSLEDQRRLEAIIEDEVKLFRRWFYFHQAVRDQLSSLGLDREKISFLFLVSPEKTERALYFVGIDPQIWSEKWSKDHSDEKLQEEEKSNRIRVLQSSGLMPPGL